MKIKKYLLTVALVVVFAFVGTTAVHAYFWEEYTCEGEGYPCFFCIMNSLEDVEYVCDGTQVTGVIGENGGFWSGNENNRFLDTVSAVYYTPRTQQTVVVPRRRNGLAAFARGLFVRVFGLA
jgi:hypothetical protein